MSPFSVWLLINICILHRPNILELWVEIKIMAGVMKKIENEIMKDLSIVNIPFRKQLHESLVLNGLADIVQTFVDILSNSKSMPGKQSVAAQLFDYYTECKRRGMDLVNNLNDTLELGSDPSFELHASVLLNFYSTIVLKANDDNATESQCRLPTTSEESQTSLLCLGGGTLGEIINVCKKRVAMLGLSTLQRQQARLQLQYAKHLCMSREEKTAHLPEELKNRDRGGMYFPVDSFVPFICEVNLSTLKYANKEAFNIHRHDLLKVST